MMDPIGIHHNSEPPPGDDPKMDDEDENNHGRHRDDDDARLARREGCSLSPFGAVSLISLIYLSAVAVVPILAIGSSVPEVSTTTTIVRGDDVPGCVPTVVTRRWGGMPGGGHHHHPPSRLRRRRISLRVIGSSSYPSATTTWNSSCFDGGTEFLLSSKIEEESWTLPTRSRWWSSLLGFEIGGLDRSRAGGGGQVIAGRKRGDVFLNDVCIHPNHWTATATTTDDSNSGGHADVLEVRVCLSNHTADNFGSLGDADVVILDLNGAALRRRKLKTKGGSTSSKKVRRAPFLFTSNVPVPLGPPTTEKPDVPLHRLPPGSDERRRRFLRMVSTRRRGLLRFGAQHPDATTDRRHGGSLDTGASHGGQQSDGGGGLRRWFCGDLWRQGRLKEGGTTRDDDADVMGGQQGAGTAPTTTPHNDTWWNGKVSLYEYLRTVLCNQRSKVSQAEHDDHEEVVVHPETMTAAAEGRADGGGPGLVDGDNETTAEKNGGEVLAPQQSLDASHPGLSLHANLLGGRVRVHVEVDSSVLCWIGMLFAVHYAYLLLAVYVFPTRSRRGRYRWRGRHPDEIDDLAARGDAEEDYYDQRRRQYRQDDVSGGRTARAAVVAADSFFLASDASSMLGGGGERYYDEEGRRRGEMAGERPSRGGTSSGEATSMMSALSLLEGDTTSSSSSSSVSSSHSLDDDGDEEFEGDETLEESRSSRPRWRRRRRYHPHVVRPVPLDEVGPNIPCVTPSDSSSSDEEIDGEIRSVRSRDRKERWKALSAE